MSRKVLGFTILFAMHGLTAAAPGIDEGWSQRVLDTIELEEYSVTRAEGSPGADTPSFQAFNRAQRFAARFAGDGLALLSDGR